MSAVCLSTEQGRKTITFLHSFFMLVQLIFYHANYLLVFFEEILLVFHCFLQHKRSEHEKPQQLFLRRIVLPSYQLCQEGLGASIAVSQWNPESAAGGDWCPSRIHFRNLPRIYIFPKHRIYFVPTLALKLPSLRWSLKILSEDCAKVQTKKMI